MNYRWVEPYLARVRDFLGLQAWELSIHPGEVTKEGILGDGADAQCHPDWSYLNAAIVVSYPCWLERFKQPNTGAKLLICHEMLHVLFAGLSHSVEEIVNIYLPADDDAAANKSMAFRLYTHHEEHTIVRFARQVYEALEWHDRQETENRRLKRELKQCREAVAA